MAPPPLPRFDADTARRFLQVVMDPEAGVTELRVFKARFDKGFIGPAEQYAATLAGWYDSVDELIADLGKLRGVSGYITINPVNPDLFARSANKIAKQRNTTTDADIVIFRWLYIDIDPRRPAEISSTDEELAAAVEVRDKILADHATLAESAIWGRSGNGAWILVNLPDYLPEEGHDLAVQALAWISGTYSNDAVDIDVRTKNPSRVGVIPGTAKCKGSHIAERPHRLATMDNPDRTPDDPLMPFDLRAWLAAVGAQTELAQSQANGNGNGNGHANGNGHTPVRTAKNEVERIYRASCYLDALAPAVSGQGGHDQTFDAACSLVKGFGLSIGEARPLLAAWNMRCVPPWSDRELEHKLNSANDSPDTRPRGYLFDDRPPNRVAGYLNGNGHANSNGHANGDGDDPDHDDGIPVPSAATIGKKSPLIDVTPQELVVNNHVCDHLHKHTGLYQRNYRLVEVASSEKDHHRVHLGAMPAGMPTIVPLAMARLREIISSVVAFRSGVKFVHPPEWCVSAILNRQRWAGVPVLSGIVEHPILRRDGSISNKQGYDEETGILCVSDEEFLPVPEHPTQEDAREAAQRLMAIVDEFPFHGPSHKAAWLACLLTILCRHLIDDAVPLFLVEATAAGTGKTLLCDLISRIATGRDMIRSAYHHDPIEMDKRIVSTALGGIRVTMLDNVSGAFGNSSLDNALTGRWYQGRILGQSEMTPPLLLDTVFVATGNNLNFHGDLFRRIIPCRLESPYERPDKDKTEFAIQDIRQYVLDNRASLLRDAFIVCRAYIRAGCPHSLPTNVYGAWTRIVRGAVVWVMGADPMEGQADLAEADVARSGRATLIEGFAELLLDITPGKPVKMTGNQILNILKDPRFADRYEVLREGISILWSHGLPSSGSLGKRLMNMRNGRVGNYRLVKVGMNKRTAEWSLQQLDKETDQWGPLRSLESAEDTQECVHSTAFQDTYSTESVDFTPF
jgi:hypothetical protein